MATPEPPQQRLIQRGRVASPLIVVGAPRRPLSDVYHFVLATSWPSFFGLLSLAYVVVNAAFAGLFLVEDGSIANADGSFLDAFFFSVQTMATIGYGGMSPGTTWGHVLVTIEAFVGLLGFAMATGMLFAKFARPTARVLFSKVAVISKRNGVPTLQFRVANQRGNQIVEAQLRIVLARNEKTAEGETMRRFHDLALVRSSNVLFVLTWTAMHVIDESSLLYGQTPESLLESRSELIVSLTGLDDTFSQTVHARHSYIVEDIRWGSRFVDILSLRPDGRRQIDYTNFHDVEPSAGERA